MTRRFVGVDPGLSGGVAVLELGATGRTVHLFRTPVVTVHKRGVKRREYDVPGMYQELAAACGGPGTAMIALELLGPRPAPGAGGQGRGLVSAFRSGVGFGLWHGLAVALQRPVRLVPPATWKRHAGLLGCDKAASRLRAAELYPEVGRIAAADEGPAEALLLAHWLAHAELAPIPASDGDEKGPARPKATAARPGAGAA